MKFFTISLLCAGVLLSTAAHAATNVAAKTTGHIASAKLTLTPNKTDPVLTLAYQCDLTPGGAKIKSPVIAFHFVAGRADGKMETMSGWLRRGAKESEDMVEYDLPKEKSRIEPLLPAEKLRTVKGWIKHHPTVQFGVYGKIVLYRVELWLDGELLDVFESKPSAEAKAAGVPDGWYKKVGVIGGAEAAAGKPQAPQPEAGAAEVP